MRSDFALWPPNDRCHRLAQAGGSDAETFYVSGATLAANVEVGLIALTSGATLTGNGGVNTVIGNNGNDIIDGGAGNDTLIGDLLGSLVRGNDTFVLHNGTGSDFIYDFESGTGALGDSRHDILDIRDLHFANFTAVLNASTDVTGAGPGVAIALDADDAVFLSGLTKAQLTASDFLVV